MATRFTDNDRFRAFTYTLAQALILDDALFFAVKLSVDRERPNGENNNSFPSGHTSNAFTIATVANHYYGKKGGIPAFAVAIFFAVSRLEKNKHYLSDVVFGATLGYIAARTALRGTARTAARQRSVSFHPALGLRRASLFIKVEF